MSAVASVEVGTFRCRLFDSGLDPEFDDWNHVHPARGRELCERSLDLGYRLEVHPSPTMLVLALCAGEQMRRL